MKRKGTGDIRRVITPAWQRLVASHKRTLRSHSARVARSVWSRLQSRVIECRNSIVEVFLFDPGGTALRRALLTKCGAARPASVSGAKGRVDIPGTWESLYLPVRKTTGLGRSRIETSMVANGVSAVVAAKQTETGRVPVGKRKSSWSGTGTGSLSPPIVAFENWETFSGGSQ